MPLSLFNQKQNPPFGAGDIFQQWNYKNQNLNHFGIVLKAQRECYLQQVHYWAGAIYFIKLCQF
jgi:hypothetical protein